MCQHPYICQMMETFENSDNIFIIMEYFEGGDLFDYLKQRKFEQSEARSREIFY
jgi:serine/threonine protein kinase